MNLTAEKEAIIKQIADETDMETIQAVKELLIHCHDSRNLEDEELETELKLSLMEADKSDETPWKEVAAAMRKKYAQ